MNEERKALNRYLATMETKLKALFGERYTQVMKLHTVRQAIEGGAEFEWRNNVRAQKDALRTLKALSSDTKDLIENGITYAYGKGEKRAEKDMLNAVGGDGETQEQARKVCEEATKERRKDGKDAAHLIRDNERLTRRVWNLQGESLKEIEIIIQNGMMEGKSADEMARECEKYLNEPQKLFRRVWNEKTGEYELSKAARNYHPGTGVYRSSYKNALRMVRTEVNNAYRDAEWQSYQNNPLVKKYRINLSSNHTTTTTEGDIVVIHDICDELAGVYPKSFKWHGWHPQCRCYMTPITMTPSEFGEYLKSKREGREEEDEDKTKPKGTINEMPRGFKDWVRKNLKRIKTAIGKNTSADFVNDNAEILKDNRKIRVMLIAAERHAKRTEEWVDNLRRSYWITHAMSEFNWGANKRAEMADYWLTIEKTLGVKKGRGMTIAEADETHANPVEKFTGNCQTCCPTYVLRRYGFNVIAKQSLEKDDVFERMRKLDKDFEDINECKIYDYDADLRAFFDRQTEKLNNEYRKANEIKDEVKKAEALKALTDKENPLSKYYRRMSKAGNMHKITGGDFIECRGSYSYFMDYLNEKTQAEGIYEIYCGWKNNTGHVFIAERKNGALFNFDPQTGEQNCLKGYFETSVKEMQVWRVDSKKIPTDLLPILFEQSPI